MRLVPWPLALGIADKAREPKVRNGDYFFLKAEKERLQNARAIADAFVIAASDSADGAATAAQLLSADPVNVHGPAVVNSPSCRSHRNSNIKYGAIACLETRADKVQTDV